MPLTYNSAFETTSQQGGCRERAMRKRVLIVEDDMSLSGLLCSYLSQKGFEIDVAEDGITALTQAREFEPDLILLDLTIDGLSGLEVCKILSRQPDSPPIIIVSGLSRGACEVNALHGGASDYVSKPFTLDELLDRIRAVLQRTSNRPEGFALESPLTESHPSIRPP